MSLSNRPTSGDAFADKTWHARHHVKRRCSKITGCDTSDGHQNAGVGTNSDSNPRPDPPNENTVNLDSDDRKDAMADFMQRQEEPTSNERENDGS